MKKVSFLLTGTLLLSACSKTIKEIHESPNTGKSPQTAPVSDSITEVEAIKAILSSQAPNMALAELLAKTTLKEKKDQIRKIVGSLSASEVEKIITEVQRQNNNIRKDALYHGQVYEEMPFLKNSLKNELTISTMSLESELRVSVYSYIKNKALDEIVSTYDRKARELTDELAEDIAFEIAQNKSLAEKISRESKESSEEKVLKTIKESKEFIGKIDTYFKTSNLNQKEQYTVLIIGAIAGGIYTKVKDDEGFKRILKEGKRIVRDINELKKKAEAAVLLVKTIGDHMDATAANIRDFSEGLRDSTNEISQMYKNAKDGFGNSSNVDSKRVLDFLYTRVIKGKEADVGGKNPSILSQGEKINESIKRTGEAAVKIGQNLDNILKTAQALTKLLKVGPNNDIHKVIKTASQVASVVSTAGSVMTGFAAGGPFGAAVALTSSPLMSGLLGGGGSKDSAMLDEISRKLDIVISNQREMMRMQIETMNMIKEVALMIDQYHQVEMTALSELRDQGIVIEELAKLQANSGIRSCEQMISYRLSSELRDYVKNPKYDYNISNVRLIRAQFNGSITDLTSIQNIAASVKEDGFRLCSSGISQAFGEGAFFENPLKAIYSSNENQNLVSFEREKYLPLLQSFNYFFSEASMDALPLHFPSSDLKMLAEKSKFMNGQINAGSYTNEVYEIESLISVKAVERYLTSLLILHPLIELDKSEWENSYDGIISTYLSRSNHRTRSGYFLRNALKFVQSSIAQESLLAGEPILEKLYKYNKDILSSKKCTEGTKTQGPSTGKMSFLCAIRNNTLLMKNFVMYSLNHQKGLSPDFIDQYKMAYLANDLDELAKLLNSGLPAANFKVIKNITNTEIVLTVTGLDEKSINQKDRLVTVKLPTPEALGESKLLYSENMPRLLLMQELVLENLEKVSPVDRVRGQENLPGLLMVAN